MEDIVINLQQIITPTIKFTINLLVNYQNVKVAHYQPMTIIIYFIQIKL